MLTCSRCGTELADEASRCPNCGKDEEKYGLYRKMFEAKRLVYVRQVPG